MRERHEWKALMRNTLLMALSIMVLLNLTSALTALAETYVINGKSVSYTSANDPGDKQCWEYANRIYNIIWGVRFDSNFVGYSTGNGYNMLRNLGDSDRRLTADHLKSFVGEAAVGAVLRIGGCTTACSEWGNDGLSCNHSGHSLIIVAKSSSGFTTFERLNGEGRRERTWTWDSFCREYAGYPYIKYIKWPNAGEYTGIKIQLWGIDENSEWSGKIKLWAKRSDSDSNHYAVFYIDDQEISGHLSSDSSGYFSIEIDTTRYSNGQHKFSIYYANTQAGSWDVRQIIFKNEMSSGYGRTIPDGNYIIGNASNPKYYLDIDGSAFPAATGTNVQVAGPLTGDPEPFDVWTVKYNEDGFYTIKQMNSNMSLDVYGASIEQCANIEAYPSNTSSAQKWAISENGRNGYRIQAKCSGMSLDANWSVTNGANIQQYSNNDGDNQAWVFIPYRPEQPIENGRYILLSGIDANYELGLQGEGSNYNNSVNVALWNIDAPSQYNSFDVVKLNNGYYSITHVATGKRLDVINADRSYGANIGIQSESNMWSQQWAITKNGSGYTLRTKTSGYALDISQAKAENGANAEQYPYHGRGNQTWIFVKAEHNVSYDANGGTGAPSSQTKYWNDSTFTLSALTPVRDGYKFIGWNMDAHDGTALYQPGDSYTEDDDLTLYAVWATVRTMTTPDFTLPASLTAIGESAFAGGAMTVVKCPEGLREIGAYAFKDCKGLKEIYIPASVESIDGGVFDGCPSDLTIFGHENSVAQVHAKVNGIEFVAVDE